MRPGTRRVKSKGQSIEQPVMSTTLFSDSTPQVPLVVEETSNSRPDQENLALVIAEEEVTSRTSRGSDCSSKGKEFVAKGSIH